MKSILTLLRYSLCFLLVTSHASWASDGLDRTEKALIQAIDANLTEASSLLEKTVNINSGTFNLEGVTAVGKVFQQEFDALGFDTRWLDGSEFDRAGHLIARHGHTGPKILMIGHLDTVFAKDDPFTAFTPLSEEWVAGPGITDMKGGNVIILEVLRALKKANVLEKLQVWVVLTGDEEASGRPLEKSKAALVEAAKWADIALGFEDGDSNIKTAVVARRGSVTWELQVTGRPAHSSQIFSDEVGYGAIFELARILDGFRQQLDGLGKLTINPGIVLGGTTLEYSAGTASGVVFGKSNVVAKDVYVRGGLRALTPQELATAKARMQKLVEDNLKHTQAKLVIGDGYPPMAPTQGNYALLRKYSEVSEKLGYGKVVAVNPSKAGAADISFAAEHVAMALDGLGLMGAGGHTKDERADMSSLRKNMHKAALLMYQISETPVSVQ